MYKMLIMFNQLNMYGVIFSQVQGLNVYKYSTALCVFISYQSNVFCSIKRDPAKLVVARHMVSFGQRNY